MIDGDLSMYWADYRKGSKKAKVYIGFDLNRNIPERYSITDGNGAERPFVSRVLSPRPKWIYGSKIPMHRQFDTWQEEKSFLCAGSRPVPTKSVIKATQVNPEVSSFMTL
ncbi:MAG: hypothetical protein SWO11_14690 [Thermodesulfobacteriota bacterium]|nr:hypothetical protein [Thermodesulfobacteriota bacterium]